MREKFQDDLTERLIGAAMEVHRTIGPGLDEKVYENALCIELSLLGLFFEQQKRHTVFYKNRPVGNAVTDLIVESRVILETKVVDTFHDTHTAQLLTYLNVADLQIGLLLNFKNHSLQFKRIVRSKPNHLPSAQSA